MYYIHSESDSQKQLSIEITIGIILFQLKEHYQLTTDLPLDKDYPVKGFRIWQGENKQSNVLYLAGDTALSCNQLFFNGYCISIAKTPADSPTASRGSETASHTGENIHIYELINELQNIFQVFQEWSIRMEQILHAHGDFLDILNNLEETYGIISILVDKNLKYLSMSDRYPLYNSWLEDSSSMSLEMIHDLMTDENFIHAIDHDSAFLYYFDRDIISSYCYNVKIDGTYEARLLIQNLEQKPFYGGLALATYTGIILREILLVHRTNQTQKIVKKQFYSLIQDLLHGISKSTEEIRQQLQIYNWSRNHNYQVYLFQFIEEENRSVTMRFYQTKLQELFGNCCVLKEGEWLCCVRNLSLTPDHMRDTRQTLSVFLRENLCHAGISQPFSDIALLHYYYLESVQALTIGLQSKSTLWYYQFDQMVLPYIWKQATETIQKSQLYHPAIRKLVEYDRKEQTELVKTMYLYMKHHYNVTQTAAALYIHRTTMLFRLNRIKLLTGFNWDSWEECLHLAITFELMKQDGELQS